MVKHIIQKIIEHMNFFIWVIHNVHTVVEKWRDNKMSECKQCGEEMNPVQAILSSTHGVCGKCCRKNQKLVFIRDDINELTTN